MLIALLTGLTAIRLYYKLKFRALRFLPVSREEGVMAGATRIALGIPLIAATVKSCFFPHVVRWMTVTVPESARIAGFAVAGASLACLGAVHETLGANFSTVIERDGGEHTLVTSGPYRLVRHPMYSTYLLFFLGAFLLSANWVIGASGIGIIVSLMVLRLPSEETLLIERFGDAYTAYRRAVPRFVPRLRVRRTARRR